MCCVTVQSQICGILLTFSSMISYTLRESISKVFSSMPSQSPTCRSTQLESVSTFIRCLLPPYPTVNLKSFS